MFDIGFLELLIIAVIALVVLGPERLPHAIKVTAVWVARIKRSFNNIRTEIEKEINADEIRQEIHNATVMDELKKTKEDLEKGMNGMRETLNSPLESLSSSELDPVPGSGKAESDSASEPVSQSSSDTPLSVESTPAGSKPDGG